MAEAPQTQVNNPENIGIYPQCCYPQQTALLMKEKAHFFSLNPLANKDDDFDIDMENDGQKMTIMKVKGHKFSASSRKDFTRITPEITYDAYNRPMYNTWAPLFSLRESRASFHGTLKAEYTENKKTRLLFTIKPDLLPKYWVAGPTAMTVTFANIAGNGEEVVLRVKGSWLKKQVVVEKVDGTKVAEVNKKSLNLKSLFMDKQTYGVEVQPYVDQSLIAAICLVFDEREHDKAG